MPKHFDKLKQIVLLACRRTSATVSHIRGHHNLVRADFNEGSRTMYNYLCTHRNKYARNVGVHFFKKLYEAGPDVLAGFAEKQRLHGWHFKLDNTELVALCAARDTTCTHTRISNLRYTTNIFNHITNKKQLARMLGVGAVAGSAGILLGLGELFFFAKEYTKDLMENMFGIRWSDGGDTAGKNAEFVDLAKNITNNAINPDGSLNADIVAEKISTLVASMETADSTEQAVSYMNADATYIIGIITGILILIIGRGFMQLTMEGFSSTVAKIDSLVRDMDEYCEWKIGRTPFESDIDPERLEEYDPERLEDRDPPARNPTTRA